MPVPTTTTTGGDGGVRRRGPTPCYHRSLRQAIDDLLPVAVVPAEWAATGKKWRDRQLVLCGLMCGWDDGPGCAGRFDAARHCVGKMYPSRARPGTSYNGFADALGRYSRDNLPRLQGHLREQTRLRLPARHWLYKGRWALFAADGSRVNVPDTAANEAAFGVGGRHKAGPQQTVTTLFHLGSGLPWAWRAGGARDGERGHLLEMLPLLPERSMLVVDAGFTGYDLLAGLLAAGGDFLVRVGSNVSLLRDLGHWRERDGTVYLWPAGRRDAGEPPLVLRLVRRVKGRGGRRRCVYLLTSVLDRRALGDAAAGRIYRMRWEVEVMYRSLKQTMEGRKMRSDSPARARVELDWLMLGLWVLGLMCVAQVATTRRPPKDWSPAAALAVVRAAIARPDGKCPGGVRGRLRRAVKDRHRRRGSKAARNRRDKKKDRPPGKPKARKARKAEVAMAKEVWTSLKAA